MLYIRITLLFLFSFSSFALTRLPILKTKTNIDDLRYVAKDGVFTIFVTSKGELLLSKNYKSHLIYKDQPGTNYFVYSSNDKKYFVAEAVSDYHTDLNFKKQNKILLFEYGENKPTIIGYGSEPGLHLGDQWASYYNMKSRQITFVNTKDQKNFHNIKLRNTLNSFFIPSRAVISNDKFLYTDLNKSGYAAILLYDIGKGIKPLLKTKQPGTKLEMCQMGNNVIIGEFSYGDTNVSSNIYMLDISKPELKINNIYSSAYNDLGNIVCDQDSNAIFFVKTLSENLDINYRVSEAVALKLSDFSFKIMTDLEKVEHIIKMDDKILIPYQDRYYIIQGNNIVGDEKFNTKFIIQKDGTVKGKKIKKTKKRKKRKKRRTRKRRVRKKK